MEDYKTHLAELIEIRSHRDLDSASVDAPFGQGIHKAFQFIKTLALDMGFMVNEEKGYALDIRTQDGDDYIGILCHIDTVEAIEIDKWNTDPYILTELGDNLYGRGVNDNKGPLLGSLYVLKLLKDHNKLKQPVRLIIGGAEETTWECMEHYFMKNPQPKWAFSPDGDFPIVNGEKGTLQTQIHFKDDQCNASVADIFLETEKKEGFIASKGKIQLKNDNQIELTGRNAVSRHPERGVSVEADLLKEVEKRNLLDTLPTTHSFSQLVLYIKEQVINEKEDAFNIHDKDPEMGDSSVAITYLSYQKGHAIIELDFRYTRTHTEESLLNTIKRSASSYDGEVKKIGGRKLLFIEKDSKLINVLQESYENVTGHASKPITKGGASYARVLKRGVAFGATFPSEVPNSHLENEKMSIQSIKKAMKIYLLALEKLAK